MSDSVALVIGLGIGFLIGLPAVVAYRHDLSRNFRRLLSSPDAEQGQRRAPRADLPLGGSEESAKGLSPVITTFGMGAGILTAVYGAFSGGTVFISSGIFVALCACLAFFGSRAVKD
jgi:hypothetical protein